MRASHKGNCMQMSTNEVRRIDIPRTLWTIKNGEQNFQNQDALLKLSGPAVILGEAGLGKSHLMSWIATHPGYKFCTARQMINRPHPATLIEPGDVIVIDALDEVSSRNEGDALDLVLRQLGLMNYPHFLLACRVADWRSATGVQAIREQYPSAPIEFHLSAFSEDDSHVFLADKLGESKAKHIAQHFRKRGLAGMLGNPQTLSLVAEVAATGSIPDTKTGLFEKAVDLLCKEHRAEKISNKPSQSQSLDAVGAAFAALIITGSEAISTESSYEAQDVPLQEVSTLPGGAGIEEALDSRLFRSLGGGRFTYLHRRIGEFMAARWLSNQSRTPRGRRRILAIFHDKPLVPSSLRGLHAWLAQDPQFATKVVSADPAGIIEYGDMDGWPPSLALTLLNALIQRGKLDPYQLDRNVEPLAALFQPVTVQLVKKTLASEEVSVWTKRYVLKAMRGVSGASEFSQELKGLVSSSTTVFTIRSAALEALLPIIDDCDKAQLFEQLARIGDGNASRLVLECLKPADYSLLDDETLIDLIVAQATSEDRVGGVLYPVREELPAARLSGCLKSLIEQMALMGKPRERRGDSDLTEVALSWIVRAVKEAEVSAKDLWSWLRVLDPSDSYVPEVIRKLDEFIMTHTALRREIQSLVLAGRGEDDSVFQSAYLLQRCSPALSFTEEDVIAHLNALESDASEATWKALSQLVPHDEVRGQAVRDAAKRLAMSTSKGLIWLEMLAHPEVPEWQLERDKQLEERRRETEQRKADSRASYLKAIEHMRAGEPRYLVEPASAYLNLFSDLRGDAEPLDRLRDWLGDDLAEAAISGFEAFTQDPGRAPNAKEVAEAVAEGMEYRVERVIVAHLAELQRTGRGFGAVSDDRLMTGSFALKHTRVDSLAKLDGLEKSVDLELTKRGVFAGAMNIFFRRQFLAGGTHVHGLADFMREKGQMAVALELAKSWMSEFPVLPLSIETEFVNLFLSSGDLSTLRGLAIDRSLSEEADRANLWQAVLLLVDFELAVEQRGDSVEPNLIWAVRDLSGGQRSLRGGKVLLDPQQAGWVFAAFRAHWPFATPPRGGWAGDQNPWDATEYLVGLLRHLGADPSESSRSVLCAIEDIDDGYKHELVNVKAENEKLRVEAFYVPPTLEALRAVTSDGKPVSTTDLVAYMLEEIEAVQAKIVGDDVDSWRQFYDDHLSPLVEERCRDILIGLLRQTCWQVELIPELHVVDDREVDISCASGMKRIPIEVKGQWHPDLWQAADTQLARYYGTDWRAEGRGIYLVLWFGEQQKLSKRLRSPGQGQQMPSSPAELSHAISTRSQAVKDGLVKVVVLDLSRKDRASSVKMQLVN